MVPGVGVAILKVWKEDSKGRPQQAIWNKERDLDELELQLENSLKKTKKTDLVEIEMGRRNHVEWTIGAE
jgi:hypothetical protein